MPKTRRSLRLPQHDYSGPGSYFITICVEGGELLLTPKRVSDMVAKYWRKLPLKFNLVELDEFIIMPNHIHGIINVGADPRVCPDNHNHQKGEYKIRPYSRNWDESSNGLRR